MGKKEGCLIQAGGKEPFKGVELIFVPYIGYDPKVAEGYPGALVVLNHKGHLTVGLVRSAHFPVDPGIFVYQVPIVVDSQAEGFG